MSITELLSQLKSLPRDEKLQVFRLMASELTQEAGVDVLQSGATFPIWTPFGAHDAAQSLQQLLDDDRVQK